MTKKYFKPSEFRQDVLDAQSEIFDKGWSCGWSCGDGVISFKRGFTTYLYSHPHQGKTVYVTGTLIHLAKNHDLNICIYSPEMGGKKEVTWNLIQVYAGKRMYGKGPYKISINEIEDAMAFIEKHFVILEHNPFANNKIERFTVKDIFNQVHLAQKHYGKKIDVLCIDPFNLLDRELEDDRKAIQDYVLSTLSFINSVSKDWGLHTILVAHLAGDEVLVDKDTGIEYMPKPHPSKLAGGQSFWRAGYQMIGLHRLPFGMLDKSGFPYPENAMWVICQKSKPFGVGRVDKFEIYYDPDSHTLYENHGDNRYRCGDMESKFYQGLSYADTSAMKPSKHFMDTEQLEAPF